MIKVFIDGKEGTTGLQLYDRLAARKDIQLLVLADELRKDVFARSAMLNASDYAFLCLPDAASIEAVEMLKGNAATRVIDASTAHRTQSGWAYGFPELSAQHRENIKKGKRVAVPGCHASGFIAITYPLVAMGIAKADYPFVATSVTGYSGGGKKMIAHYEAGDDELLLAPRQYGLEQKHKHLKEMQFVAGLSKAPIFEPYVANFYSGMQVSVPLYADLLNGEWTVDKVYKAFSDYYAGQKMVSVERVTEGFISAYEMHQRNDMKILIGGNDERILLSALFDNLGKGASGAAVQCLNIMMGLDECVGLM